MLMDPDKPPAFCKILLSRETFMNKMQVPSCFIKQNKKMLSKACLLRTDEAGKSWEAKIERQKENYFICEGDWPQFVVHHKLEQGDILIFSLTEKSTFHVKPYTQKCCTSIIRESQLFYEELSSSSSEEENIGPSKRAKKMKPTLVVSDTEEESSEESKHEYDPPYSHRATYFKNPKLEKADDQEDEEDGPKKYSQSSLVNINGGEPYYEIVVKKSHVTFMTIPMTFAKRTGIIGMKKMRLVNEKGEEWKVDIVHTGARISMKKGWSEFRIHNKIAIGESCRFKLIQGHVVASVLQVQKIPTPSSLQYY